MFSNLHKLLSIILQHKIVVYYTLPTLYHQFIYSSGTTRRWWESESSDGLFNVLISKKKNNKIKWLDIANDIFPSAQIEKLAKYLTDPNTSVFQLLAAFWGQEALLLLISLLWDLSVNMAVLPSWVLQPPIYLNLTVYRRWLRGEFPSLHSYRKASAVGLLLTVGEADHCSIFVQLLPPSHQHIPTP